MDWARHRSQYHGNTAGEMIRLHRSSHHFATLLLVGACARTLPAQKPEAPPRDQPAALDPRRFEVDIRAFEAADRSSPPPRGGIVFVGSSSIKNWTHLAADFPGMPVLNRGFGGSTLANVVYYMGRIVLPYQPRLVVLYAGDNDIAEGRTPGRVLADYRAFAARLRSALPQTRLAFVSIKPSPARRSHLERMRETNRRIRADIARDTLQSYVDVFAPMLAPTGQPRPELFEADSLHMTRAGYTLWHILLAPVVRELGTVLPDKPGGGGRRWTHGR